AAATAAISSSARRAGCARCVDTGGAPGVPELPVLLVAAAVGGALAWLGAGAHFARIRAVERAGLESRVLAAEAVQDELRKQLSGGGLERSELRAAAAVERAARGSAESGRGDRERRP